MRFCNECNDKKKCNICNNQINENKEFAAYLNELKGHQPNDFGHMLYFNLENDFVCNELSE